MYSQELMEKAKSGDTEAMRELAMAYVKGDGISQNLDESLQWMERAAQLGDAKAQSALAEIYRENEDFAKAFNLEQQAAKQGLPKAQYNLAIHYRDGVGTSIDSEKQFYWFQQAAQNGHTNAKSDLALCYLNGIGVVQDQKLAFGWWKQAAIDGSAEALGSLGSCHYFGYGVPRNKKIALELWAKAAAEGDEKSKRLLLENRGKVRRKYALGLFIFAAVFFIEQLVTRDSYNGIAGFVTALAIIVWWSKHRILMGITIVCFLVFLVLNGSFGDSYNPTIPIAAIVIPQIVGRLYIKYKK